MQYTKREGKHQPLQPHNLIKAFSIHQYILRYLFRLKPDNERSIQTE